MPIGLTNFTAKLNEKLITELEWQTATETNNSYFTIEKSSDGMNYQAMALIDGAGTSTIEHAYRFSDPQPFDGITYYRIRQTDYNGKFNYSPVRLVQFENERADLQIYPNPSNGEIVTLGLPGNAKLQRITFYNAFGQPVYEQLITGSDPVNVSVTPGQLPVGVYTVIAIGDEGSYKKKMVVE
jgi:hypothetical protein